MSELPVKGPPEEQEICVTCGLCCDATLFSHAFLFPGERGHLPEKIEANSYTEGGNDYFMQPCPYFTGECNIYDVKRADVCSSFRCQLLKDFAGKKITLQVALETVRDAINMRQILIEKYRSISGENKKINFRQVLTELGRIQKAATETEPLIMEYEMLIAGCNIFDALLIKHIRSAIDFEDLMIEREGNAES